MWDIKQWFLKFVVHAVWKRWKGLFYAVSLLSIIGNLVVLLGPSLHASIVSCYGVLQAAWSILPQVTEVVLHRSVLYILLNLIVLRIMVKSGVLGRTSRAPIEPDEFCHASSYFRVSFGVPIKPDEVATSVVRGALWPASNTYSTCSSQAMVDVHAFSDPSMVQLQQAHGDVKSTVTSVTADAMSMDIHMTSCVPQQPRKYTSCDDEQPKCAPAPSLFTIEPLHELLQEATEHHTLNEDQSDSHMSRIPEHCLHKVISREDLSMLMHACGAPSPKDSMRPELPQQSNGHSAQVVAAAKKQVADQYMLTYAGEDDVNELSRQEFNERVDTFISKFKRNLTMQRQDSSNRLLGLMGGRGDIEPIL